MEADEGHPIASLSLHGSDRPTAVYAGRAVALLEAIEPNFGFTALDILDDALSFFCTPCTPQGAYWMAQYCYWQGEKDEQEALESYGEEGIGEDTPTRDELFDGIPEWAYGWEKRKRLSRRRFAQLAKDHAAHPLGPFLLWLTHVDRLVERRYRDYHDAAKTRHLFRPDSDDYDGEIFEPPAAIYWARGETGQGRIFDDYYQYYIQGNGGAPYVRFFRFELKAKEIAEALKRLRHTGRMCQALDKALVALDDWEKSS